jgi:LysR family glycine cleavage system transcriptional activator
MNALRAFEVAARCGSFTLAAEELGVSQGAVSRHIQHLEDALGTPLFERGHRLVALTAAGRAYAGQIREAFDEIETATRQLHTTADDRPVRLRAFPNFVYQWLLPRLDGFIAENPQVQVEVTTADEGAFQETDEIDLTVQVHHPRQLGFAYHRLFELALVPVCTPAVAARLGQPAGPDALLRERLLQSARRPQDWAAWFRAAGDPAAAARAGGGLVMENSASAYRAALSGLGIALAQREHVEADIAAGLLASPWPVALKPGAAFMLVSRRRETARNVLAFRRWLLRTAARRPAPGREALRHAAPGGAETQAATAI